MIPGLFIPPKKLSATYFESIANVFSGTHRGLRIRFLLAVIITLIFTAGILQWSFHYGRLAYDITYDDVGYFLDAYSRIKILYEQGLGAMITGLFHNPPHGPYSTLLAMTGFAFMGPRDWVPYAMNCITIFLFLGFLTYILRNIPFLISAMLVVMFLFVPLSFFVVHEFRPDYAVAVLTCLFAFLAFESIASLENYDSFKLRCAGAVFGLALLSKPSFFAHTLALGLGVSILITLHQLIINYRQWRQGAGRKILSLLRNFYLPGIILAAPYYAINWRHIWDYFWLFTRGQSAEIWSLKESYWEVLKAFTVNRQSSAMISSYLFLLSAIVIFSMVFLFYKKKWRDLCFLVGLVAVAIASLGIVIYGRHNNPYFSLTYQIMLCCATCYCISSLYRNKTLWFVFIVSTFIVFSGWHMISKPLPKMVSNETQLAHKGGSANLRIINVIKNYLKEFYANTIPGNIFVSFAGEVNAYSMQWLALQESMPLQFSDLHTLNDLGAYKGAISESDFVVVADEDAAGIYRLQPSYTVQKPVLDFLRTQPDLEEIMTLKTSNDVANGYIRLFANHSRLQKGEFTVILPHPVSGFLPPEGPYPQWKLPMVRWGLYPESEIFLPDKLSGNVTINLSARGQKGIAMGVTLNKIGFFHHVFITDSFEDITIPVTVTPGKKVIGLTYDKVITDGKDKYDRTILFQNIRIMSSPKFQPTSAGKKID
jgi:hypothetical protein